MTMMASDTIIGFIKNRKGIYSIRCSKCVEKRQANLTNFVTAFGHLIAAWAVGLWGDGWCNREGVCLCPECAWGE